MSLRTLWNWEHRGPSARPPGRPRGPRAEARALVRAELERQGWSAGEGPIHRALAPRVKLRLVRELLHELKAEHGARLRRVRARTRLSLRVHGRDVLWSLDQTHLGRTPDGRPVQAEVLLDVASLLTLELTCGSSVRAADVIAMLERARVLRGALPLALAGDLGSENENDELDRYLAEHQVVRLRNLPRTPQHNPWAERSIKDLKDESQLGKGVLVRDHQEPRERIAEARARLDHQRLRRSRGWQTAVEHDRELSPAAALVDRRTFYPACQGARERAILTAHDDHERRRAERKATLATLVCFGLITMYRGGARTHAPKPETVL